MERKSNYLLIREKEDFVTETDDMQENIYNYTPMYFGTLNSTVVATQIGATAHLPCIIHHIGDGVVSCFFLLINFCVNKFSLLRLHRDLYLYI